MRDSAGVRNASKKKKKKKEEVDAYRSITRARQQAHRLARSTSCSEPLSQNCAQRMRQQARTQMRTQMSIHSASLSCLGHDGEVGRARADAHEEQHVRVAVARHERCLASHGAHLRREARCVRSDDKRPNAGAGPRASSSLSAHCLSNSLTATGAALQRRRRVSARGAHNKRKKS
jgi:hypothetical protein